MKKLWLNLLVALLACALLSTGVMAESASTEEGAEWLEAEVAATPLEEGVEESEELDLGDAPSETELTLGDSISSDTPAAYEAQPTSETPISDFTLSSDGKALKKYTGAEPVVSIPAGYGITTISAGAFKNSSVTSVTVPEGVTTLEPNAFNGASLLTIVKLPNTLASIGLFAFEGCSSLESISIPGSVVKVSSYAFQNCYNLKRVTLGEGVTIIEDGAFYACARLSDISLPSSLKTIGDFVFYNCDGLTTMTIPEGVTTVGQCILWDCDNLTTVNMPKSVTSIGARIFQSSKNATMRVYYNSYAQKYCESNGVSHTVIDAPHVHTVVTDAAVAVTCTTSGLTEGSHCATCGEVLVAQETIPATGHTVVTDAAVAATTLASGLTEGSHCSTCGEVFVAQETIPQIAIHLTKSTTKSVNVGESYGIVVDGKTAKSYKSSNKNVVKVTKQGVLTAKREGKAKITITLSNKKKLTLTVKVVNAYAPSKVKIAQGKKTTMKVGDTLQLEAVLSPSTAKSALRWDSSSKAVASVSKKGLVKARRPGMVRITVGTTNKKRATIVIKVVKK